MKVSSVALLCAGSDIYLYQTLHWPISVPHLEGLAYHISQVWNTASTIMIKLGIRRTAFPAARFPSCEQLIELTNVWSFSPSPAVVTYGSGSMLVFVSRQLPSSQARPSEKHIQRTYFTGQTPTRLLAFPVKL